MWSPAQKASIAACPTPETPPIKPRRNTTGATVVKGRTHQAPGCVGSVAAGRVAAQAPPPETAAQSVVRTVRRVAGVICWYGILRKSSSTNQGRYSVAAPNTNQAAAPMSKQAPRRARHSRSYSFSKRPTNPISTKPATTIAARMSGGPATSRWQSKSGLASWAAWNDSSQIRFSTPKKAAPKQKARQRSAKKPFQFHSAVKSAAHQLTGFAR